ncbi:unnamed protein product [Didymodactylos carnosus]|uniref:G-protein coupled receptors family 1 profile domain-containing protein n=1 Tax=Didymodactylos carnosus TaxID=1234261 RepID=A0A813W201_9BILA|nr:unnamed protein product [Didymodactylos carnosus]CAF3634546.1 unnamed protein product [Didymodactylos carnosus]
MDLRTASSAFRYTLILASWIISITFASSQLFLRDTDIIRGMRVCGNRSDVRNWNIYVYFLFITVYLAPLIIITICYIIIIDIIWKKSSLKKNHVEKEQSKIMAFMSFKRSVSEDKHIENSIRNAGSLGVIPRAKIKTVKMTLVIVIAFTACWSPCFLLMIMGTLNMIRDHRVIRVTSSMCYLNSLANPLIYWLFATNFCLRYRQNLTRNKRRPSFTSSVNKHSFGSRRQTSEHLRHDLSATTRVIHTNSKSSYNHSL